jgi:PAS domain S-box-containing protein
MSDRQEIERAAFEEVLRQMPAAVMIVEAPSGETILANRRTQQMSERYLGSARLSGIKDLRDLHDSGVFELLRPDGRPYQFEEWPVMRSITSGEEVRNEDVIQVMADGIRLTIRCNSSPIYDEEGRIVAAVMAAHDITEQKHSEENLKRSEERFRLLVEGVKDYAIFMLDTEGHIESWNEGARRINGYSRQEILGQHFSNFYPPEDVERGKPERELREAETHGVYEEEGWRVRKDGSTFWASVLITALRDEAGRLLGFAKVTRDISERKKAEEEQLRESHRRTEDILESITEAFLALDREWRISYLNGRTLRRFRQAKGGELTREDFVGKNLWEVFPDVVGTMVYEKYHEAMREQRFVRFETYYPPTDAWYEGNLYPFEEGLAVYSPDITERKRAEDQLRYHADLLENIHDTVMATDEHFLLTAWNKGAEQMYGWTADEVLGRDVREVLPTETSEEQRAQNIRELAETGRLRAEAIWYRKDRTPVYAEALAIALRGEQGQITGYLGIHRDITERKRAEQEKEKRTHQQAVVAELGLTALANDDLQALMDAIVALVAQTLDTEYSKIMELLPGGEELLLRAGVGWREGLVGEAKERAGLGSQAGYTTLISSEAVIVENLREETRFEPPPFLVEHGVISSMTVVIPSTEGPFGVLGVHTRSRRSFSEDDINFMQAVANVLATAIEREAKEERLEEITEAERSRIARDLHDEALQDISGALVDAQRIKAISTDPEASRLSERLLATLDRVEPHLRGAIYDLRLEREQDRPFSELLEELVELQRTIAPHLQIALDIHDGILEGALGETGREILRIVGEALTNARRHSEAENVWVRVGVSHGTLCAEVEDDGRGFGPTQEEEPTPPAATTTGGGGVGIRAMRERTNHLGGDLRTESERGKGTKVRFELVLHREGLEEPEEEQVEEEVRVLLVDDHAAIRDALASTFEEEEGFKVVGQAGSMADAQRILAQESVDMAVIDLGLPDGYGADLIKELREKYPQAQALVLSATLDRAQIAGAVERGAAGVLSKTAHLDEVVGAVRRLRAGETLMPLEEVVGLLRFAGSQREQEYEARQAIEKLTPREIEVLQALALGLDSEGIAQKLHIALRTERNHMASILAKLGVHSQLQALVFAQRHGVVEVH